jgi:hypothetical protein
VPKVPSSSRSGLGTSRFPPCRRPGLAIAALAATSRRFELAAPRVLTDSTLR